MSKGGLMQTFLPSDNFFYCGRVLHPKHLGNQFYREGLTLLRGKWPNHPASKMWRGYTGALCRYLFALHVELESRGKSYPKHLDEVLLAYHNDPGRDKNPPWLGDEALHASHRSNLLRKDKEYGWGWYEQFGWTEPDNLEYIWPV
jgi:hypothetical protein